MNITKTDLFKGCLIASIAHAIMTNVYPDLSYEQSWDGMNYSIQNSSGIRGTITFERDFCVGAVRNENSRKIVGGKVLRKHMRSFPSEVIDKAYEETFQYLLLQRKGVVAPYVTSVFWANHHALYYEEKYSADMREVFTLLDNILLPVSEAVEKWKQDYEMDAGAVALLEDLYQCKAKDFLSTIELSTRQKKLIPGTHINDECVEALKELHIVVQ